MKCDSEHNIGHIERIIRVGLGLTLLAIGGLTALPMWGSMLTLILGIVALLTGLLGFCPAWRLLGVNTCHHTHAKGS
ncbi:YgaP family membrane protein [Candidatus Nitrospira salsa]|nr:MAG: hypothetical protein NPIRA04_02220 [Nitrospirales bacterium]